MRYALLPLCLCVMIVPFDTNGSVPDPPEAIFVAGRILTLDGSMPEAEAIAVKNGVIQAVGKEVDIVALAGNSTTIHRLEKALIVPGLVDAHCHLLGLGLRLFRPDRHPWPAGAGPATREKSLAPEA